MMNNIIHQNIKVNKLLHKPFQIFKIFFKKYQTNHNHFQNDYNFIPVKLPKNIQEHPED